MNNKGVQETHDIPLDAKQLLLKGAKLRNTSWIIGIVVYTGHNCKIMKNSKDPVTKYSSVELLMNKALIFIFILQAILCIISACLRGYYYNKNMPPPNGWRLLFGGRATISRDWRLWW